MKTKVKELRTSARMTQQQLADLVHVSSRTIISVSYTHLGRCLHERSHRCDEYGYSFHWRHGNKHRTRAAKLSPSLWRRTFKGDCRLRGKYQEYDGNLSGWPGTDRYVEGYDHFLQSHNQICTQNSREMCIRDRLYKEWTSCNYKFRRYYESRVNL